MGVWARAASKWKTQAARLIAVRRLFYLGRWWDGNKRRSQKALLRHGGSNPSARTSSKGAVLLDCAWENVRADAGTGIQAALRAPCASVRVRIPVGTPQFARVVELAATAVLNTAAFGRGSSSLLSRTGCGDVCGIGIAAPC